MSKKIAVIVLSAILLLLASACEEQGGTSDIYLEKDRISIAVGEKEALSYKVLPLTARNDHIEWMSDDEEIATCKGGVVTGKNVGKAVITAKTRDGGFSKALEVEVRERVLSVSKDFDKSTKGYGIYNFDSINGAVARAEKGDRIRIHEGDYDEVVAISKNIDIEGAGAVISGYFLIGVSDLKHPIDKVTIDNLTFTNKDMTSMDSISCIYIGSGTSGITVKNSSFIGDPERKGHISAIETTPSDPSSAVSKLKIYNCEFEEYSTALHLNPLVSIAEIMQNNFRNCRYAVNIEGGQKLIVEENILETSGMLNVEKNVLPPSSFSIKNNEIKSRYQREDDGLPKSHLICAEYGNIDKKERIDLTENTFFGVPVRDMTENQRKALMLHINVGENEDGKEDFSNIVLVKRNFIQKLFNW